MATFGSQLKPNQITNSGASATIGVTLTVIAIGSSARSSVVEWAIRMASTIAAPAPTASPAVATAKVRRPSCAKKPRSPTSAFATDDGGGRTKRLTSFTSTQASHTTAASTAAISGGSR